MYNFKWILWLCLELITRQLVLPVLKSHILLVLVADSVQEFRNSCLISNCGCSVAAAISCSSSSSGSSGSVCSLVALWLLIVRLQLSWTSRATAWCWLLFSFRCSTTFAPGLDIGHACVGLKLGVASKDGRPTKPLLS